MLVERLMEAVLLRPAMHYLSQVFLMYGLVKSRLTQDGLLVSDVEAVPKLPQN